MKFDKETLNNYYKELVEKKIIEEKDIKFADDDTFNYNSESLIDIVEASSDLIFDEKEDKLYYVKDDERIECPDVSDGIEDAVIFLADRLPEFKFTISENQEDYENDEIESIYCVMNIAMILERDFKKEMSDVIKKYDFNKISVKNRDFITFKELLNEWLQLQSRILQAIVSASRERIASKKEQYSSLELSRLKKEERLKLNIMKDRIRMYFNEFKREQLNAERVKHLKKHQIYELYDKRNSHINESIIGSKEFTSVVTLYMLDKLNYEDISPIIKKKIYDSAVKEIKAMYENEDMTKDVFLSYVNKLNRKGVKVYLRKWKNEELTKYLEDKINYKLPKKL